MPLLEICALCITPLQPFNAQVNARDLIMLSGESGSGKSRLLYALADLIPYQGKVELQGKPCHAVDPAKWRRQVMLIPSKLDWWFDTAAAHFNEVPSDALLAQVNLKPEQLQQPLLELSTGQKQRLGILRAIVRHPKILMLDEATANLDEKNTQAIEALILNWLKQGDRAVIWCSHDSQQAARIATRQWQVREGKVCEVNQ